MASSEVHPPGTVESGPAAHWLDIAVPCGSLIAGMFLGEYVGGWLGGHAATWLGMGIGGAFLGGFGFYVYCAYRPHVGHPLAALRIVTLLLAVGTYGYFAERWLGRPGILIAFVLVPIFVDFVLRGFRITKIAIRAIHWRNSRKKSQHAVTTSPLWDAELDRTVHRFSNPPENRARASWTNYDDRTRPPRP